MPHALFLSPHLDDVAFSCAGVLLRLIAAGWSTTVVTCFTASVPHPQGFALSTQLDKGLPATVDYLALRRAEDQAFAATVGAEIHHLPFAEAPHRGYQSAADLFHGIHEDDYIHLDLMAALGALLTAYRPTFIFAPQGLGQHVDHLQVMRALTSIHVPCPIAWYRDLPYAIRHPHAATSITEPEHAVSLPASILAQKIVACAAYPTQVPFQFGSAAAMGTQLTTFHQAEAMRHGLTAGAAECFRSRTPLPLA